MTTQRTQTGRHMRNRARTPQRGRTIFAVFAACALLELCFSLAVFAQSKTRATVETLASSRLEGRLAGSNGEKLASDYLVAELKRIGAKPLPGQADFLEPFEFTAGSRDGGSSVGIDLKNPPRSGAAGGGVESGTVV